MLPNLLARAKNSLLKIRGKRTVKVYSEKYAQAYHEAMPVVERQMQRSIKLIGDFWFTAWIEAGQPDLSKITKSNKVVEDSLKLVPVITPPREHQH